MSDDNDGHCLWTLKITAQSVGMEERTVGGFLEPYWKYQTAEYIGKTTGGQCKDAKTLSFSSSYRSNSIERGSSKLPDLSDDYDFHLVYSPGASPPVTLGPLCNNVIWQHIDQQVVAA